MHNGKNTNIHANSLKHTNTYMQNNHKQAHKYVKTNKHKHQQTYKHSKHTYMNADINALIHTIEHNCRKHIGIKHKNTQTHNSTNTNTDTQTHKTHKNIYTN